MSGQKTLTEHQIYLMKERECVKDKHRNTIMHNPNTTSIGGKYDSMEEEVSPACLNHVLCLPRNATLSCGSKIERIQMTPKNNLKVGETTEKKENVSSCDEITIKQNNLGLVPENECMLPAA